MLGCSRCSRPRSARVLAVIMSSRRLRRRCDCVFAVLACSLRLRPRRVCVVAVLASSLCLRLCCAHALPVLVSLLRSRIRNASIPKVLASSLCLCLPYVCVLCSRPCFARALAMLASSLNVSAADVLRSLSRDARESSASASAECAVGALMAKQTRTVCAQRKLESV